MAQICVYLGSRQGEDPRFIDDTRVFGRRLAERGHGLVYGGASVGLMGALANAALDAGGQVVGVMPHHLVDRELAHTGLSELIRVADMHERKAQMAASADAFVMLPGGIGTLEEFFETWTWHYLGLHAKPIGILDSCQFYRPLLDFLEAGVAQGFLDARTLQTLVTAATPDELLDRLEQRLAHLPG
ncbi:TIGR00730 family Rossman fold protein [Halomonas denitrificans]|uniref:LOG family protein n=1 Tax=Halomonas TaxID=2745 RepID=UPI001A8C6E98|nr:MULTISPECIES: TIGR00730 family Rossman fold protein [Halomonas]MBN8411925.1 TIGR00730 family Rossman fold protein [Halomonas litopenaei]MBY5930096.1 TIGR00730 family Rossman fold protein [Halomonas sp. DP8Y7-3]MBY5970060.1 TIGR00730 family Rossman fold protein [Halomonas denitrificans]MBY5985557.1 TIGR00730 family Rossman fold protein [Halomonas sp. DP5Y7-2]MBY6030230.1 TIGR00730 family Rossman fold protein [Halomonas sp. DP8Y7-1]